MAINEAKEDLKDKLAFEKAFERELKSLNRKLIADFKREFIKTGRVLDATEYREQYEELFQKHYEKVGKRFSSRISPILPEDIEITEDEADKIFEALALYYIVRSGQQSLIVTNSNQDDIDESVIQGNSQERDTEGEFSRITAAGFASAILFRRLSARRSAIVITETQNIAETAKMTEAEVLTGLTPSITGATTLKKSVMKEWITVGDERVRETHVEADGQTVEINDSFIVGGQILHFPGDTSRGATAKEIINCRCSSQVNVQDIIKTRSGIFIEE